MSPAESLLARFPAILTIGRTMLVLAVACLLACLLTACASSAEAIQAAPAVAGAIGTIAAAWVASLQQTGSITPEQAAEWQVMVGGIQSTVDAFQLAAKATAQAIGQVRADLAATKAGGITTEQVVAGSALATTAAVAAVQKLRGPSATPDERQRRRGGQSPTNAH